MPRPCFTAAKTRPGKTSTWPEPMPSACGSTACSCPAEVRVTRTATAHGAATKATPATMTPMPVAKHPAADKVVMIGPTPDVTADPIPDVTPNMMPNMTPDVPPGVMRTRPRPDPRKRRARNPADRAVAQMKTGRIVASFRPLDAAPDTQKRSEQKNDGQENLCRKILKIALPDWKN
ncbi:hypothetical protein KL86DES1_20441 [uncultured Desulfovibrio sp.]|uniref:Uncharacterized protein n=1 Tax=uncultured Desulfovibrio sp. TaxID=167968 RepID=A0A212L3M8_9BACT|nr:hypothetical protein KL86DES1_20441 [uncultured Desulfovibrio sp.]